MPTIGLARGDSNYIESNRPSIANAAAEAAT
jgi:hypothetical protein